MSAVDSPQTNAPPPRAISTSKENDVPKIFSPRIPPGARLLHRDPGMLYGQGIFIADIDVAFLSANGPGPDHHPLDYDMRDFPPKHTDPCKRRDRLRQHCR